jgi:hypothetical protein
MRRIRFSLKLLIAALLPLAASVYIGCEDSPSSEGLDAFFQNNPYISDPRVTPSAVTIRPADALVTSVGETLSFTAAGGSSPYTWQVSKPSAGSVQAAPDNSIGVYIANQVEDNNVIVADRNGQAAIANLTRVARGILTIVPSSATLTSNRVANIDVQFTATGGYPPYSDWTASAPSLGVIDQNGRYTAFPSGIGVNVLSVKDSRDSIATATVTQQ